MYVFHLCVSFLVHTLISLLSLLSTLSIYPFMYVCMSLDIVHLSIKSLSIANRLRRSIIVSLYTMHLSLNCCIYIVYLSIKSLSIAYRLHRSIIVSLYTMYLSLNCCIACIYRSIAILCIYRSIAVYLVSIDQALYCVFIAVYRVSIAGIDQYADQ